MAVVRGGLKNARRFRRLATAGNASKREGMNARAFLIVTLCAGALAGVARGEDCVYLRNTTGSKIAPRYEVLSNKPLFPNADVIRVPAKDVAGLEKLTANDGARPNYYVARTSPSVLPDRYEVRILQPGVSYLQSVGGGGGAAPVAKATPAPAPGKWQPRGTMLDRPAYRR